MAVSKPSSPAHRRVRRLSLRTTLFFETFSLMILTVLCVAVATFFLALHELNIRVNSQLQTIVENKAAILETTVFRQREQVSALGQDPDLRLLGTLTTLVGFEELLRIGTDGSIVTMAGQAAGIDPDVISSLGKIDGTVFRPILGESGWTRYVIASPQRADAVRTGTLVAVFDASNLVSRLLHADEAGKTAEVLLGATMEDGEVVLRFDETAEQAVPLRGTDGNLTGINQALRTGDGVVDTVDYAGIRVLAAFRAIPTLGWAVIAKIDRYEATAPVLRLAVRIGGIGAMVVVFLSLSTFFLTRRIIGPLEELVRKLDGLEARRWKFGRTISTGDEIETVDIAAADLTQRLRAAHEHLEDIVRMRTEQLRHEHARDQAILQSMDDGLVVTDAAGKVTYMNRLATVLTGIEGFADKHVTAILKILSKEGAPVTGDDHPASIVLRSKARYAPAIDPQFALLKPDGTKTALQIRATPILRGQRCDGMIAIIRDISEERRIDRMKSEFISLVSHQLRTPLSTMRWYLEMLITEDEGPLNQSQKEYVGQAAASNARMVHLVNALLNVSRIELGKFQLSPESIDLADLVRGIAATFDTEMRQKKIVFSLETGSAKIGVRSDKGLLLLIIENLIGNAVKYSAAGGAVRVAIRTDAAGSAAVLTVEDHGIGIPQVQQKDIGRRLFRAANAVKTDTDGNGLGLYISHVAADSVGADLTFTSAENKGTVFTLTIPLDPKKND